MWLYICYIICLILYLATQISMACILDETLQGNYMPLAKNIYSNGFGTLMEEIFPEELNCKHSQIAKSIKQAMTPSGKSQ